MNDNAALNHPFFFLMDLKIKTLIPRKHQNKFDPVARGGQSLSSKYAIKILRLACTGNQAASKARIWSNTEAPQPIEKGAFVF